MKVCMSKYFIREVWKLSFSRKDAYHCEIFDASNFDGASKLNISQWYISFLMKYEFHTSRIKGRMSKYFIREVWKSSFIGKDAYHCEIFDTSIFDHASKLNISQWCISFLMKHEFYTPRMKEHMSKYFIREVWKLSFIGKDVYHWKIFNASIFMAHQN